MSTDAPISTTDSTGKRKVWQRKRWADMSARERLMGCGGAIALLLLCGVCSNVVSKQGQKQLANETATAAAMPTKTQRPTALPTETVDPSIPTATATERPTDVPTKTPEPKANLDSYNRVDTGMKCEDLPAILGNDFTIQSESEMMGIKSQMIVWNAPGIANITIMCQNGEVTTKAQFGLK